jgi:hypothetical protein
MEDIMSRFRTRFATSLFVAAVAIPFAASCDEDPVEPEDPADAIVAIRLTAGTQNVTITEGSAQGSFTLPIGATNVTATFLDEDDAAVTLDSDEFEIQLEPSNTALVTFARTGAFAGTLTGVAAGNATVQVQLFHKIEGHPDFGPRDVNVTVQ